MPRCMNVRTDAMLLYMFSLAVSYGIVFFQPQVAFPFYALILCWSYFLIILKGKFFPVFALIIYARAFVGFSATHGPIGYNELNVLTNYLPAILYFLSSRTPLRPHSAINAHPWTYLYGAVLIVFSLASGTIALQVMGDRLLPFFLFLLLFTRSIEESRLRHEFLTLMRYLVISTITVTSLPGYSGLSIQYLGDGTVFGAESITSIYLGDLLRGTGPFWDPRILGTMCAIYLAVALSSENKLRLRLDLVLALAGVAISLSRGAVVLTAIIFLVMLSTKITRTKMIFVYFGMIAILIFGSHAFDSFISPMFFANNVNPLEQRSAFFEFAIFRFLENPLGSGVGSMRDISDSVNALGNQYFAITDAYIAILLAEVGFIGFIVFLLSFRELFWGANPISRGLFVGFIFQMLGTDLGDFGMYYFVIMIVGSSLRAGTTSYKKMNAGIVA